MSYNTKNQTATILIADITKGAYSFNGNASYIITGYTKGYANCFAFKTRANSSIADYFANKEFKVGDHVTITTDGNGSIKTIEKAEDNG